VSATAAAHKVHNLQTVPFAEPRIGPFNAGNDRTVMLDGYPIAFQVEAGDQILEIGPGRQLRKVTRLAVEDELHNRRLTDSKF
jgi:hypothetical protein